MNDAGSALGIVEYWIRVVLGFFASIFAVIEGFLHNILNQLGIPANVQSLVILVAAVVFIVAVLRFFGGLIRVLLVLFLILLVLHILLPNSGF